MHSLLAFLLAFALVLSAAWSRAGSSDLPPEARLAAEAEAQAQTEAEANAASAAPASPAVEILPARELQFAALPERPGYTVYVPAGPDVPRSALLVLHGMGSSGPSIASRVVQYAHANDWVVIAPTIAYGEWRDPSQLASEELRLQPRLNNLLDYVPVEAGVPLTGRAMVFGFSRGAQAGLRFAMLYPERVHAVAALSAGTYTLPVLSVQTVGGARTAPLPYGVADLEQRTGRTVDRAGLAGVRFWIGVGAADNRDGDVPREWDPFVGKNRVERAHRFAAVLSQLGCEAQVTVVPGAGHEIAPAMLDGLSQFLSNATALHRLSQSAAAATAATTEALPRYAINGV